MVFLIHVSIMASIAFQRTSKSPISWVSVLQLSRESPALPHELNQLHNFYPFRWFGGGWLPPLPVTPLSATSLSAQPSGVCAPLPYSPLNNILPPTLPPPSGICLQFGMGRRELGLASPEGMGPPDDIVQRSPWRTSSDPPVGGWVDLLMRDDTTFSGWCRPPGDLGKSPVLSPDRRQFPPRPPLPSVKSPQ